MCQVYIEVGIKFYIINFRALINNYIKYIQQNAQIFQYIILYLKNYTYYMLRSIMDYLHGETTSIVYV
jgi:hypothetical protein